MPIIKATDVSITDLADYYPSTHVEGALSDIAEALNMHKSAEPDPHAQYLLEGMLGQPNGAAPLDASGKIDSAYLPAIALTDVHVVGSEAEQLALTAEQGDVAVRTDINRSYVHNGGATHTMADWQELNTPTQIVSSVFGRTGVVVAAAGDYHAGQINVLDAAGNFAATDVEGVLAELAGAGSGLTYFTETRETAVPNAIVPVHALKAMGAETNIDVSLVPKGAGALTAQVADDAVTGGQKRGIYAVDWQTQRNSAAQVASGELAVIAGGDANMASGELAVVGGGFSNTASDMHSTVAGGSTNTASNWWTTVAGGCENIASNTGATVAGGFGNAASGQYAAVGGGGNHEATGWYSTIPGGRHANTRGVYGRYSYAGAKFSLKGDAQLGVLPLICLTGDATPKMMVSDFTFYAPKADNVSVLPDNHVYGITASVVARSSTNTAKYWEVKGLVKRGVGAATVAVVGTPSIQVLAADAGTDAWNCELIVDATLGSAEMRVTGAAATTIHWFCEFVTREVG